MKREIRKATDNQTARTGIKILFAAGLLAGLAGCATGADPKQMVIAPQATERPFPGNLLHAMCVRNVTGGEETNPLWASKVDNKAFGTALGSSLDAASLAAPADKCAYQIDVDLLGLSQPTIGFDMTVTSHVNYKVYDSSGAPYLLDTVDAPFTATVSDAFVGTERLKLANEGSIRTSIQMFFDKLRETLPK